ncbi:hypothetical protein ABZT47_24755 [Sphaerisporangium sp. NPDC005289]
MTAWGPAPPVPDPTIPRGELVALTKVELFEQIGRDSWREGPGKS